MNFGENDSSYMGWYMRLMALEFSYKGCLRGSNAGDA